MANTYPRTTEQRAIDPGRLARFRTDGDTRLRGYRNMITMIMSAGDMNQASVAKLLDIAPSSLSKRLAKGPITREVELAAHWLHHIVAVAPQYANQLAQRKRPWL